MQDRLTALRRCAGCSGVYPIDGRVSALTSQAIKGRPAQMLMMAADYPFMDVLWSMIIFFFWVIWIWIVITVLIDIFDGTTSVASPKRSGWSSL